MDHQVEIKIEAEDPSMPDIHVPNDTFIKQEGSNMFTDNPHDKSNLSGPTPVDVIFPVLVQGTETSCNIESLEGRQDAKNIRLLVLRDYRNFKDLSSGATIQNTPLGFDDFSQGKGGSLKVPTATLKAVSNEKEMKNEFQECGILPNESPLDFNLPAPIEVQCTKKKLSRSKSSNLGKEKPKRKTSQLGKPRDQMADAKALKELELFAGQKGLQQIKPKPLSAPAPEPNPTYLRNNANLNTSSNLIGVQLGPVNYVIVSQIKKPECTTTLGEDSIPNSNSMDRGTFGNTCDKDMSLCSPGNTVSNNEEKILGTTLSFNHLSNNMSIFSVVVILCMASRVTSHIVQVQSTGITCWTCRNMGNNQECNDWAPDLYCPTGDSICQSVHSFYSESRESIRVEKRCVSPEKCSRETVGCTTDSNGIMTCISCCSTPYCNEHVAHDNHTAVRLSVTVIESSASNDISDWLFLLVIAMVIAAM